MGFNSNTYNAVLAEFDRKRNEAESNAQFDISGVHLQFPRIAEIDRALSRTAAELLGAVLEGGDVYPTIEKMRVENDRLQAERAALLEEYGLPANIGEPDYECKKCGDRGYVNGRMCECFRRALVKETIRSSGIGRLVETQSFDNFSTDYYKDDERSFRQFCDVILPYCRDFVEEFGPDNARNALFIGGTGLGKTHLSTSIAKGVIERGYDVIYGTAQNVFRDFERQQFGRPGAESEDLTEKYFECDLLIIDDLGTELTNNFTVSCLYNLINTRINGKKPMIISTNLSQNELRSRYEDRVTSRLFGEFDPLFFIGKDVRFKKRI